jgi:hypothetical protein
MFGNSIFFFLSFSVPFLFLFFIDKVVIDIVLSGRLSVTIIYELFFFFFADFLKLEVVYLIEFAC